MKMPGMGPRAHDVAIPSMAGRVNVTRRVPDAPSGLVVVLEGDPLLVKHAGRLQRALTDAHLATVHLEYAADADGGDEAGGGLALADHVVEVIDWTAGQPDLASLPLGLFGAGDTAGATLLAAARRPDRVGAVVAPAGRMQLAGDALMQVGAPTLLIVGGEDLAAVDLNRAAMRQVRSECELQIVPGAGRQFEESGAADTLVDLTREWFQRYLARALGPEPPRKPREGGGT
jgi:putative phosphoribosyl transferase